MHLANRIYCMIKPNFCQRQKPSYSAHFIRNNAVSASRQKYSQFCLMIRSIIWLLWQFPDIRVLLFYKFIWGQIWRKNFAHFDICTHLMEVVPAYLKSGHWIFLSVIANRFLPNYDSLWKTTFCALDCTFQSHFLTAKQWQKKWTCINLT